MIEPGAPVQFLDSTLGAIEIGVLISSLLYGLNCGQVYTYAISPRPRSALMTAVVASVTALESIHLIFMWIYFFNISVTNFGNVFTIASVTWRYSVLLGAHALLVTIIELFFCYRVWVLSRSSWLALPPALATLARGGITLTLSAVAATVGIALFHNRYYTRLFYATLIISAVVDMYISVSLCTLLWRKKSGLQSTAKIVNRIIYWTIETGIFTTITAVAILAIFSTLPFTGCWNALLMIYPRLYAHSFLISLGAFRGRDSSEETRCVACQADLENCTPQGVQFSSGCVDMPGFYRSERSQDEPPPLPEKSHGPLISSFGKVPTRV